MTTSETISRRTLIAGAGAALMVAATPESAATQRITVIYAPHPDDEFLYLGAYVQFAARRGDRMILVAATNGDATSVKPAGWTKAECAAIRRIEQEAAWRSLTQGRGEINWLGNPDSATPDLRSQITALAEQYEQCGSDVEHYVAGNDGQGQGVDHDSVALGIRDANVRVRRFANRYDMPGRSTYRPSDVAEMDVVASCYLAVGQRSVGWFFRGYRAAGYVNKVVL